MKHKKPDFVYSRALMASESETGYRRRLRPMPLARFSKGIMKEYSIPEQAKAKLRDAVLQLRLAKERFQIEKTLGGIYTGGDECVKTELVPTRNAAVCYKRAIRLMQQLADEYPNHPRILKAINRILQKGCLEMERFADEDPEFRLNGSGFILNKDVRDKMIYLLECHLAAI